jgi:hypothetical protein
VISLVSGVDVARLPITTSNVGPLAGTGSTVLPRTSLRHVDQNITNAIGQFWSLALQREAWAQSVFSIEYSGSRGDDLYTLTDPNRPGAGAVFLGDADPLSRLNQQYSNLNTRGNLGFSRYHGLTLGYETPFLRDLGLHLTARYTWSHAIDNLSSTFSESANNFNLGLLDPFNPALDRGDADFDVRHRLVTSWVWEIPVYRDSRDLFGQFLGGWSLTGIFTAQTGTPFTVFDCTNGLAACIRALQAGEQAAEGPDDPPEVADVPNRFRFINFTGLAEGTYVNPITGTSDFGPFPSNMTGRNAFRGPGFWNLDAGLYKSIRITEGTALQLRFEAYNVFNHANLFVLGSQAFVDNGLGYVPARRLGRRNIQLAAKLIF